MEAQHAEPAKRRRGRPLAFDRDAVLRQAMTLFWERGYEGTSFDELIAAMGLSASSFYNSFGCKEQLYREAIELYSAGACWFGDALLAPGDTRAAFATLMEAAADAFTQRDLPAGCMISLAGTHLPPSLKPVRDLMVLRRGMAEQAMLERLQQGVAEGDLPGNADIDALAALFSTLLRGMAVQARDGADKDRLLAIGRAAMRGWPGRPGD